MKTKKISTLNFNNVLKNLMVFVFIFSFLSFYQYVKADITWQDWDNDIEADSLNNVETDGTLLYLSPEETDEWLPAFKTTDFNSGYINVAYMQIYKNKLYATTCNASTVTNGGAVVVYDGASFRESYTLSNEQGAWQLKIIDDKLVAPGPDIREGTPDPAYYVFDGDKWEVHRIYHDLSFDHLMDMAKVGDTLYATMIGGHGDPVLASNDWGEIWTQVVPSINYAWYWLWNIDNRLFLSSGISASTILNESVSLPGFLSMIKYNNVIVAGGYKEIYHISGSSATSVYSIADDYYFVSALIEHKNKLYAIARNIDRDGSKIYISENGTDWEFNKTLDFSLLSGASFCGRIFSGVNGDWEVSNSPNTINEDGTIYVNARYKSSGECYTSFKPYGLSSGTISWDTYDGSSTSIKIQLRTNSSKSFVGPDGTTDTYYETSGSSISSVHDRARNIQAKILLGTSDAIKYSPVVKQISIRGIRYKGFIYDLSETACFISTISRQNQNFSKIKTISKFRNDYLLTNILGKKTTNIYYRISPQIIRLLQKIFRLKKYTR
jgi:hypothetical protein